MPQPSVTLFFKFRCCTLTLGGFVQQITLSHSCKREQTPVDRKKNSKECRLPSMPSHQNPETGLLDGTGINQTHTKGPKFLSSFNWSCCSSLSAQTVQETYISVKSKVQHAAESNILLQQSPPHFPPPPPLLTINGLISLEAHSPALLLHIQGQIQTVSSKRSKQKPCRSDPQSCMDSLLLLQPKQLRACSLGSLTGLHTLCSRA
jgi:hypothetical protein